MTATTIRKLAAFPHTSASGLGVWATIRIWHERSRQRARLAELPPAQLRDIGVSKREATAEAAKPFWLE